MADIGRITFNTGWNPLDISPRERLLEREPGFTVEHPPARTPTFRLLPEDEPQITHWEGCWREHLACAVARVEQLEDDIERERLLVHG